LPPVAPPSAKFLVQLFVVPALIVGVLVLLALLVTRGGPREPEAYLADLRSTNGDVRWRAAEELAQVLPQDREKAEPRFAYNVPFALELATLMRQGLQRESELLKAGSGESKALDEQRNAIRYLVDALGDFNVPVTAPILGEIAARDSDASEEALNERRRFAATALGHLGDNLKYYHKLPPERQQAIRDQLDAEAADTGERGRWAHVTAAFLQSGKSLGVEEALNKAAVADNALVREAAALSLGVWDDPVGDEGLMILLRDDGRGAESEYTDLFQHVIRYQAVQSLARRGSPHFAQWLDFFAETLDEPLLLKTLRFRKEEQDVPDAGAARTTILNSLTVLPELHRKRPELDLSRLAPALAKLADNRDAIISGEAKRARQELGMGS
jgi:hypothetical protein